ncbi:TetR/AcrR family transcriptional regulator [Actinacidiphila sp. DG2A-62]|uniref:TetR/AcrR family transcriptional regulator n=1 Tax=Actinacidiphila sp. DG2A-62 TaxID=3108821 RepID=UPI002DB6FA92|nr:TetR/AcrR family transcriptional regulator [Actinacidiphila sp. DG2A-62]MEC3992530.1 TetR/AcrR family transcriptional regulator [Actinacidiphila sp. DG2A-62]
MPRPKSSDRRAAIMSAATRVIAAQGLGAATATIAREAGVSNGSLFTYFDTKADLLNHLYLELKTEMGAAAVGGMPAGAAAREQLRHMWSGWLAWAAGHPEKRRALAQLQVSDEISEATHQAAARAMKGVAEIMEGIRAQGAMRDAPLMLVSSLMNALADATIDFVAADPDHAEAHGRAGFEALWRMVG